MFRALRCSSFATASRSCGAPTAWPTWRRKCRDTGDELPPRLGDQAVHRRVDPAAGGGRKARTRRSVRTWLPTLPPETDAITIRHLLTHTSGLIDYEDLIADGTRAAARYRRAAAAGRRTARCLRRAPAIATATAATRCCALIVERASGKLRGLPAHAHLPAARACTTRVAYEKGGLDRRESRVRLQRWSRALARTDQSLTSAVSATAASIRPSTTSQMGRRAVRRPPADRRIARARLYARDEDRRSRRSNTASAGASPATRCGIRARPLGSAT